MKAPFPYMGGKSAVAPVVWRALGQPKHYIEPFAGSLAVLLARPDYRPGEHIETVCDADGLICNVWRGLQFAPDEVARWCDWPVFHACLSARKARLIAHKERCLKNLIADEKWFDAELAGYWVWAASCWIGRGLTSETCPGQRPHFSHGGMGVHALGRIPHLSNGGRGVHALGQRPHLGDGGMGEDCPDVRAPYNTNIFTWFRRLSERLRYVRVVCGDWTRVCGGDWQDSEGTVGIFFDPPYASDRDAGLYDCDSMTVARDVEAWVLERGERPSYRIVVAGYDDEYQSLTPTSGWRRINWTAQGGYSSTRRTKAETRGSANRHRECLWFSPHCVDRESELPLIMRIEAEAGGLPL